VLSVFISIKQRICFSFRVLQERISCWIKPRTTSLTLGTLGRSDQRQSRTAGRKRPVTTPTDHLTSTN